MTTYRPGLLSPVQKFVCERGYLRAAVVSSFCTLADGVVVQMLCCTNNGCFRRGCDRCKRLRSPYRDAALVGERLSSEVLAEEQRRGGFPARALRWGPPSGRRTTPKIVRR